MNARILAKGGQLIASRRMVDRKPRATKKVTAKKLTRVTGQPDSSYTLGVPANFDPTTNSFESTSPHDYLTVGDRRDEIELVGLAMHLTNRLQAFVRHGEKLAGYEKLIPVLEAYARTLQQDRGRNVAGQIVRGCARLVHGRITSSKLLAAVKGLRKEKSWIVPGTGTSGTLVKSDDLDRIIKGRGADRNKVLKLYGLLAHGSEADPPPQESLRGGRGSDLARMIANELKVANPY